VKLDPKRVGLMFVIVGAVMMCSALALIALAETYLKVGP
jgi:hypothetical protein